MKNKKLFSIVAVSLLATSAFATNGDELIGVGAKTRSMGGAGIAFSHGAESTLVNPASITKNKDTQIAFGGTIFMPKVKSKINPNTAGKFYKSKSDLSIIPLVAISSEIYPNLYAGVGMYGTAGMGVDYRKQNSLFNMETTLQLMQFATPIAYKYGNLSVGISPILQYGSLDINYKMYPPMTPTPTTIGYGQKQDFGFGVSIGAIYDFSSGFSVGAVYKSKIKMKYSGVLSTATQPYANPPISAFPAPMRDYLDQPASYGIGVAYTFGPHTIAADYKKIKWSKARGYKDFGWKDQDVFAIGYQYKPVGAKYSLRLGFNHASNPIKLNPGTSKAGAALNDFNLLGFPATSENHYTFGATYNFNKNFSMDFTLVYSPKKTTKASLQALGMGSITNTHSELSTTVQFNYKF